jgi:hypothetical protein
MSKDVLLYLSQKIRDEMKAIEDDLPMGTAKDISDYKYACGIYRGLMVANRILAETAERLEVDDE